MKENRILWITGTLLIFVSVLIFSVSAFVFEQPSNTVTINLNQGNLGNILEGQTLHYTPSNTSSLDDIICITTNQANVYLHFDTNLEGQISNYDTYQIIVKVGDTIPDGSSNSTGDTTAILTLANPDTASGVALDAAGEWTFDFEITTTAKSVDSNQASTVDIIVSVDSISA